MTWTRPQIKVEKFVPNEYVAACGDTEYGNYLFECNAGSTRRHYAVKDSSGRVAWIGGDFIDGHNYWYTPCAKTHESSTTDEYLTGYHLDDPRTPEDENIQVIIWTDGGTDIHCTTNLNQASWEVTKS